MIRPLTVMVTATVRLERTADMREHGLCMKVNDDKYHLPKGDHQQ